MKRVGKWPMVSRCMAFIPPADRPSRPEATPHRPIRNSEVSPCERGRGVSSSFCVWALDGVVQIMQVKLKKS